jgi:hypothetical protein
MAVERKPDLLQLVSLGVCYSPGVTNYSGFLHSLTFNNPLLHAVPIQGAFQDLGGIVCYLGHGIKA